MSSSNEKSPNRADQLRMRRNQSSKQRLSNIQVARKTGSGSSRQSVPAARVVSRVNQNNSLPVIKQNRSNVKKRVTIPLKSPGAELNLPSIPVFASGWRLLSGSLSLVFLGSLIGLSASPSFKVSGVDFQGFQRINSNDAAVVLSLGNMPIFMVDPEKVQADLAENFPELKDINIQVSFPADVTIRASERQPIVVWEYGEQTLWIDDEGAVFPPRSMPSLIIDDTQASEQPAGEVEGIFLLTIRSDAPPPEPPPPPVPAEGTENLPPDRLAEADILHTSIQNMPTRVDMSIIYAAQTLAKYVAPGTTIVYDTLNGLGWSDTRGWNVYIGSQLENIELKLVEYQAIVEQLETQAIRPAMISVEYVHAPFYRLE